jgi:hypothetical protein
MRANDTKAAGRHLPPRSGDAGQDEGGGAVHEVQEHLVLHPRGDRPAAEARGRAAVGMVGPSTKAARPPDRIIRMETCLGGRSDLYRPTSSARPFDGTIGRRGNTREPTEMRWRTSGGRLNNQLCARPNRTGRPDHERGSSADDRTSPRRSKVFPSLAGSGLSTAPRSGRHSLDPVTRGFNLCLSPPGFRSGRDLCRGLTRTRDQC